MLVWYIFVTYDKQAVVLSILDNISSPIRNTSSSVEYIRLQYSSQIRNTSSSVEYIRLQY